MTTPAATDPLPNASRSSSRVWLSVLVIVVLGSLAYGNTLSVPFLFDDEDSIVRNPTIRSLWPLTKVLLPWSQRATVAGRPLVNLSLAINYAVDGLEVRGYHIVNLAIHLLTAIVLFGLIRRTLLLPQFARGVGQRANGLALTCAALWAVHPLQTESVTYVIQRAESLVGLFYVLTLYFVNRGATSGGGSTRTVWYSAAAISCLLGVGCKEVIATAPIVALTYDRFFLAGSFAEALRQRRRLYIALAVCWLPQAVLVLSAGSRGQSAGFTTDVSVGKYAGTQLGAVLHYLRLTIWPHPLVFDYGKELAETVPAVLFPALGLAALIFGIILAARKQPWIGFLALTAALILAPSSSIVPIATQAMAEHRMYLALAAIIVLIVIAGDGWLSRRLGAASSDSQSEEGTVVRGLIVGSLLAACVMGTWLRNRDYQSALAIWGDTIAKRPTNARAFNNYGHELVLQGRTEDALVQFDKAIALNQRECDPYFNRSLIHENRNNLNQAILDMDQATRHCPLSDTYSIRRGALLERVGRFEDAISEFTRALKLAPGSTAILLERGNCLAALGRHKEAVRDFTEIIQLEPEVDRAWHNRGNSHAALGQLQESIQDLSKAIELNPDLPEPYANRAISYFENGQFDLAWKDVDRCREKGGQINETFLNSLKRAAPGGGK